MLLFASADQANLNELQPFNHGAVYSIILHKVRSYAMRHCYLRSLGFECGTHQTLIKTSTLATPPSSPVPVAPLNPSKPFHSKPFQTIPNHFNPNHINPIQSNPIRSYQILSNPIQSNPIQLQPCAHSQLQLHSHSAVGCVLQNFLRRHTLSPSLTPSPT